MYQKNQKLNYLFQPQIFQDYRIFGQLDMEPEKKDKLEEKEHLKYIYILCIYYTIWLNMINKW